MEFIPAASGAVLRSDSPRGDLRVVIARGPRSRGLVGQVVPARKGIAGIAVRSGVALTVREAANDLRHDADIDARTGYRSIAIRCVPIRNARATLGCVELLNPFAGTEFATWQRSATLRVAARLAPRLG